jgi:hypothetical protein
MGQGGILMQKTNVQAVFMIAGLVLSLGVQAQAIYRCGNTYSQIPCPGAEPKSLNDSRQPEQKKQSDAAVERDAKTAKNMEQARIAEENRLRVSQKSIDAASQDKAVPGAEKTPVTTTLTPKRPQVKHKKPEAFIAEVPGSGKPLIQKKAKKQTE